MSRTATLFFVDGTHCTMTVPDNHPLGEFHTWHVFASSTPRTMPKTKKRLLTMKHKPLEWDDHYCTCQFPEGHTTNARCYRCNRLIRSS